MAQRIDPVLTYLFPGATHRGWALFLSVLLLSSVTATPSCIGVGIAQQPTGSLQDANREAAKRAFAEGQQLRSEGTVQSLQQAIEKYQAALRLWRAVENPSGEASALFHIGLVYNLLGEKQQALLNYNQALPLWQRVGNRVWEAFTLDGIGGVYNLLGEKQKALLNYNQALPLWRMVRHREGEAATLTGIGRVYSELGEKQRALDYYNQALPLTREAKTRYGEASTLYNIGLLYDSSGEKQLSLNYYNQALQLWRKIGNRAGEAYTLNGLGRVYDSLGQKQSSLEYYNQALSLRRAVGDRYGEVYTLNGIGRVYGSIGKRQLSLEYYKQALPLARTVGDSSGEAATLYNIAFVERNQGNLNEALTQIEASLTIIESLRAKVASQELRASYLASKQDYYELYIDLLMQLHKQQPSKGYAAKALHASERARARSLLEILSEANADIRQGANPKLVEKERTLLSQLDAMEQRRVQLLSGNYTQEQVAALDQEIEALLSQYQEVQAQIRATSPRYAALTQPQPLTVAGIQQQVLDSDTLLLEYSLGEERSYLWAVTSTSISSYELPGRAVIEAAVQNFRQAVTQSTVTKQRLSQTATVLSQMILKPVADKLERKRLLIVSDGALHYIPFSALPALQKTNQKNSPDKLVPLMVEHEIITLPSASAIAILRRELTGRQPAAKTVAVLADPVFSRDDVRLKVQVGQVESSLALIALERSARESEVTFARLPFTRLEAEQILTLVPVTSQKQALDFTASRVTATSPQLSQYQIIHFATHGILNSVHPELSGLVLSLFNEKGRPQNGFLRLHDIYNLNLPAELVVLSACRTGLGKNVRGEGLVGLTRGFMYAGAKRVLVSLWNVEDEATAQLMTKFYQKMLQGGLKPAAALRQAQIEMWQQQQWRPYYWAGFTLQGEWR